MPDIQHGTGTITTAQLKTLWPVLAAVEQLAPAPNAKGRYALGKWAAQAQPAFALCEKQGLTLAAKVATKNEQGTPILTPNGAVVNFSVRPDAKEEYAAELAAIDSEPVILVGVRQITHAELGDCPITAYQERILIACGVLEDSEP